MEDEYRRSAGAMDAFKSSVEMILVDQTIITLYNNRLHKVSKVDWQKTPADRFHHEALGREMSYAEYFHMQYGRTVTDMQQPLLVSFLFHPREQRACRCLRELRSSLEATRR